MNDKMPAVVNFGPAPFSVELREIAVPEIGENDVLLAVQAVGICGSDLDQFSGKHSWKPLCRMFAAPLMQSDDDFQVFEVGDSVRSKIVIDLFGTITVYHVGVIGVQLNDGSLKVYREGKFYRDFELDSSGRPEIHEPPDLYDG